MLRENRRCPPGVMNTLSRPASLHRRRVPGETPSSRLASERPSQSGSLEAWRRLKIYSNLSEHYRLAHSIMAAARSHRARRRFPRRRTPRGTPRLATDVTGPARPNRGFGDWGPDLHRPVRRHGDPRPTPAPRHGRQHQGPELPDAGPRPVRPGGCCYARLTSIASAIFVAISLHRWRSLTTRRCAAGIC